MFHYRDGLVCDVERLHVLGAQVIVGHCYPLSLCIPSVRQRHRGPGMQVDHHARGKLLHCIQPAPRKLVAEPGVKEVLLRAMGQRLPVELRNQRVVVTER